MFSPIVQTTPETISLEMKTWAEGSIQKGKRFVNLIKYADPLWPHFVLACDAFLYGLSATLSHHLESDEEPIAFASYSLAPAEKNYSQIDEETLDIVIIKSDHKPLQHLFGEKWGIPGMASARVHHWALTLSAYDYKIQ